jgi:hypothetical protein
MVNKIADQLVNARDMLLIKMKDSKDEPSNYFDGVLDMYNEAIRIYAKGKNGKGEKYVFKKRPTQEN